MPRINLALQGGGAHGAFSWGVLDVLLQVPEIEIELFLLFRVDVDFLYLA